MNETLKPVVLHHYALEGFWKHQIKRLTAQWLPHCMRHIEAGGSGQELLNLEQAGSVLRGERCKTYHGKPWSDAAVFNTVEAACLALAYDPAGDAELARAQEHLRNKIEEWIPILLAAQGPDGYIHSYHTAQGLPHFRDAGAHEFYVMGYFIEMGIAHHRCTGGVDRRLADAALRCADGLESLFGPPPKRTWKNEHPGIEVALFRLAGWAETLAGPGAGERYARLAAHLVDRHHAAPPSPPSVYNQSDQPATAKREAAGHAVRATYFYSAMADVALWRNDTACLRAVDALWDNAIHRKYYLTGAVGVTHEREAFGADFELPNDGYGESCAGCGMSFWSERMHRLHGDARYRDVQERVLYNHLLGAIGWNGTDFFYQNPLASDRARQPWHPCPCCVGNIPRALLAIKDAIYSTNAARDTLYLSHFVDGKGTIADISGGRLDIRQETDYPWQGDVRITLHPETPTEFTLKIRIPNRAESALYSVTPDSAGPFEIRVNGRRRKVSAEKGYAGIRRAWRAGDRVDLSLPLEIQRVRCDPRVEANRGLVALQRGPLVYNIEDVDHAAPAADLKLAPATALRAVWDLELCGGAMRLRGGGISALPHFLRLQRGGASRVWMLDKSFYGQNHRLFSGMVKTDDLASATANGNAQGMQAEWTKRNTCRIRWKRGTLEVNLVPANGRLPTTTYARRGLENSLIYLHDNVGIVALRLHGCPAVPRICWDNREHHFWKRFNGGFRPRNTVINDIRVRTNAAARALRVSCYYITDHVLTRVAWLFREPPGDGTLAWDTLFEFENLRDRPLENYMAFFACYHAPGRNTYWDKQDRLVDCADSFLGYADATRKQRVEAVTAGFQRQVRHWTAGIDRPSRAAEFYGAPILLSEPRAWFGHGRHLLMVEPGKCAHIASIMRQARDYMLTPEDRIWEPGATFTARVRHVIAPLAGMPEVRHQWEVFKHESDETPRMDITG